MPRVIILDANHRSDLAATWSLRRRGVPVCVADESAETLAGSSKYHQEPFSCPSPYDSPTAFIAGLPLSRTEVINRRTDLRKGGDFTLYEPM